MIRKITAPHHGEKGLGLDSYLRRSALLVRYFEIIATSIGPPPRRRATMVLDKVKESWWKG